MALPLYLQCNYGPQILLDRAMYIKVLMISNKAKQNIYHEQVSFKRKRLIHG